MDCPWTGRRLIGSVLAGYLLRAEFYHASAASAPVLRAAFGLLTVSALAAVAIPGRRASLLDPSETLRRDEEGAPHKRKARAGSSIQAEIAFQPTGLCTYFIQTHR
jgi:hypothetical protein